MLPPEILKLRSYEIIGSMYFSIYFYILKVFKEGKQATRKEALCPSPCTCPLCLPVPTFMKYTFTSAAREILKLIKIKPKVMME